MGLGHRGGLGGLPTSLVVVYATGMDSTLLLVFLYLTIHNLPQLRMHSSLVPCSFFLIPYSTGKPGTLWSMALQRS